MKLTANDWAQATSKPKERSDKEEERVAKIATHAESRQVKYKIGDLEVSINDANRDFHELHGFKLSRGAMRERLKKAVVDGDYQKVLERKKNFGVASI